MSKLKSLDGLFAGRHFDRDMIILCARWYLRYKLCCRKPLKRLGWSLPRPRNASLSNPRKLSSCEFVEFLV